eukprot:1160472-Pleurochrysis_carterae.AAC.1
MDACKRMKTKPLLPTHRSPPKKAKSPPKKAKKPVACTDGGSVQAGTWCESESETAGDVERRSRFKGLGSRKGERARLPASACTPKHIACVALGACVGIKACAYSCVASRAVAIKSARVRSASVRRAYGVCVREPHAFKHLCTSPCPRGR